MSNAQTKPTSEQQDLNGSPETAMNTLRWLKWLKARVYELVDQDEIRKDRDAVRAVQIEKARQLRVDTDFASQRQSLEIADKTSQIEARRVLSLQRLKNMFVELRNEAPELMVGLSFTDFLKSCESFLNDINAGKEITEGEHVLIEAPIKPSKR